MARRWGKHGGYVRGYIGIHFKELGRKTSSICHGFDADPGTILHKGLRALAPCQILARNRFAISSGATAGKSPGEIGAVLKGYDFSNMKTIGDIDIEMMALTTGPERTRDEWVKVFGDAGLELRRILDVAPWTAVIEATIP